MLDHKKARSIPEFCQQHGICRSSFYNLEKKGLAPRVMKVGARRLISDESADAWRRAMEAEAQKAA